MKFPRWKKVPRKEYGRVEQFLRKRETFCVGACARFMQMRRQDEVWALPERESSGSRDEEYSALLLHCRQTLYPVLDARNDSGRNDIPLPSFLDRVLLKVYVHAIQGSREDVELLESLMKARSYIPAEQIDYDLMALDAPPPLFCKKYGPPELTLRPPLKSDTDQIYALQSAYEQEEVLPQGAVFHPAACRANLEHLLKSQEILLACLGREIVGKINTSAQSFNRYQIGGVYVRPGFRGMGIAVRMTADFLESLIAKGRGASLFVKKYNAAARAVYNRAGLCIKGNYRISYF